MRGCREAFRYRRIIMRLAIRDSPSGPDTIKEAHPLLARAAELTEHVTWGDEQAPRISRAINDHVRERGMGL
jgi:hypothetical protein